jgi:hypothetical protein
MVLENFATPEECAALVSQISEYRRDHELPVIERASEELPLRYAVIDGDQIAESLPEVLRVYEQTTRLVKKLWRGKVEPLVDRKVACNVNITEPGGSYRYHYDRNAVTAILYLNEIEGGETECYPDYRLPLARSSYSTLQQKLDRVMQNRVVRSLVANQLLVRPRAGRLLVMQGNRCLHSVRPVRGQTDRLNIVMSYDRPNARFEVADDLNAYLYSSAETSTNDPNYLA